MLEHADKDDISELEQWEAIRKRPNMYIGSASAHGILWVLRDLLDSAQNAAATNIVLHDNAISIHIAATPPSIALCPRV